MGELLKALLMGRMVRGLLTDAELLATTAVLGKSDRHSDGCECTDCDERLILGLDDRDE